MSERENQRIKAVILDMDGVITKTATIHAKAWKQMFDDFLKEEQGEDFEPLDIDEDYNNYIDGIPRHDGVRKFLASRAVSIPEGNPGDGPEKKTIHGLGKRKNDIFLDLLRENGVEVYDDTLKMIKKWKKAHIKLAVISSSRNCRDIIEKAGLADFFRIRVDGITLEEEHLKGKPEPDIFLKAAEYLKAEPEESVIIEDAILGVKAGKKGNFGLVVGVSRNGKEKSLQEAGADVVVNKLTELADHIKLKL